MKVFGIKLKLAFTVQALSTPAVLLEALGWKKVLMAHDDWFFMCILLPKKIIIGSDLY